LANLRPFRVLQPTSLAEATSELGQLGEQARIYAGGAELVLLMRHGLLEPDVLVDIKRIPGLNAIQADGDVVRIGATVTHHQLELDAGVRKRLPLIAEAAATIGNIRVRNVGTLGGNLCFADPHADPATPLLVHDATVTVNRGTSARQLALDEFLIGTYETAIEPDEILGEIEVPPLPAGFGHAFLRIERYHRPTLNVAVAAHRDDGRVGAARLAIGCIGPKSVRLPELESRIAGLPVADACRVIGEAKPELTELLDPVDDGLGSAAYKIHVACALLARGLTQALGPESA
jgi:aerobic carbon-monoxide dehydrogenase medium subunit